jgi:hypothetical protein
MKKILTLSKVFFVLLFLSVSLQTAKAEILFDGDWANYIGKYYDANGWKNGKPIGHPTKQSGWSDFYAYWSPPVANTWLFNTSTAGDRIQLVNDVTSPKKGVVARFEVRSGDHRDVHSGERSEMYKMLDKNKKKIPVTENSGHEFYGISIKLSDDWKGPQAEPPNKGSVKWGSFMQLHSPNAYNSPPAIIMAAGEEFAIEMNAGELVTLVKDKKTGLTRKDKKDNQYFKLSNSDLNRGKWVQFMLDVVWKKDSSGSVKLYRRDEGKNNFEKVLDLSNIPTLQTSEHIPTDLARCPSCAEDNIVHYWRVGYYRSTSPNQTNTLWLGPIVRGTEFNEVAEAAFGQTGEIIKK